MRYLMILSLLFCGCKKENVTRTGPNSVIKTVEHDGHLWLIHRTTFESDMIHHPDCGCKK